MTGKRHLAVAEVVADALAHRRLVRRIIDHVVGQLEGDAEVPAIAFQRQLGVLARFGDDRRDAAGSREQCRRLGGDDVEIMVLASLDPALRGQLLDLALGDDGGGMAEDLQNLQAAVLDHQLERARKQEVADQHGGRVAPDEVGGALAAPHPRSVDDIVVQQGGGVDELDCSGELVMAVAGVAEQRRGRERQHRPHPLAAAGDQMARKLRDQRDLALHAVEDDGIDAVHVGRNQLDQRVEAGRAARRDRMDGSRHAAALSRARRFS